MRTARSLTVSPYLVISHAHPPGATMHAPLKQPCMPPRSNHTCPPGSNHACPPREQPCTPPQEQPHMPPLGVTMHAPPGSNHACPLGATMHAPKQPRTPLPPRATTHAPLPEQPRMLPPCGQNVDTRFWKYYLAPGSVRAVIKQIKGVNRLTSSVDAAGYMKKG